MTRQQWFNFCISNMAFSLSGAPSREETAGLLQLAVADHATIQETVRLTFPDDLSMPLSIDAHVANNPVLDIVSILLDDEEVNPTPVVGRPDSGVQNAPDQLRQCGLPAGTWARLDDRSNAGLTAAEPDVTALTTRPAGKLPAHQPPDDWEDLAITFGTGSGPGPACDHAPAVTFPEEHQPMVLAPQPGAVPPPAAGPVAAVVESTAAKGQKPVNAKKPARNQARKLGHITCYRCQRVGHRSDTCTNKRVRRDAAQPAEVAQDAQSKDDSSTAAPSNVHPLDDVVKKAAKAAAAAQQHENDIKTQERILEIHDRVSTQSMVVIYRPTLIIWAILLLSITMIIVTAEIPLWYSRECNVKWSSTAPWALSVPVIACNGMWYLAHWSVWLGQSVAWLTIAGLYIRRWLSKDARGTTLTHAFGAWNSSKSLWPPLCVLHNVDIGDHREMREFAPLDVQRLADGYTARQSFADVRAFSRHTTDVVARDPLLRNVVEHFRWISFGPFLEVAKSWFSFFSHRDEGVCIHRNGGDAHDCYAGYDVQVLSSVAYKREEMNLIGMIYRFVDVALRGYDCQRTEHVCSLELVFQLIEFRNRGSDRTTTYTRMFQSAQNQALINIPRGVLFDDFTMSSLDVAQLVRDSWEGYPRVGFHDAGLRC